MPPHCRQRKLLISTARRWQVPIATNRRVLGRRRRPSGGVASALHKRPPARGLVLARQAFVGRARPSAISSGQGRAAPLWRLRRRLAMARRQTPPCCPAWLWWAVKRRACICPFAVEQGPRCATHEGSCRAPLSTGPVSHSSRRMRFKQRPGSTFCKWGLWRVGRGRKGWQSSRRWLRVALQARRRPVGQQAALTWRGGMRKRLGRGREVLRRATVSTITAAAAVADPTLTRGAAGIQVRRRPARRRQRQHGRMCGGGVALVEQGRPSSRRAEARRWLWVTGRPMIRLQPATVLSVRARVLRRHGWPLRPCMRPRLRVLMRRRKQCAVGRRHAEGRGRSAVRARCCAAVGGCGAQVRWLYAQLSWRLHGHAMVWLGQPAAAWLARPAVASCAVLPPRRRGTALRPVSSLRPWRRSAWGSV